MSSSFGDRMTEWCWYGSLLWQGLALSVWVAVNCQEARSSDWLSTLFAMLIGHRFSVCVS